VTAKDDKLCTVISTVLFTVIGRLNANDQLKPELQRVSVPLEIVLDKKTCVCVMCDVCMYDV